MSFSSHETITTVVKEKASERGDEEMRVEKYK